MKQSEIIGGVMFLVICASIIWLFPLETDPIIDRANPYLDKIVSNNFELRNKASSIVGECPSGNKECQINEIYGHVVKNYNYYSDPINIELIQTPEETLIINGGDCEDLSILLNSFLENLGIETYLVLTKNHAYSLACDVDIESLQEEIIAFSNARQNLYDEKILLESHYAKYYGGDGEETKIPFEIEYEIESNGAINIVVVPSSSSLEDWSSGESYDYYSSCFKTGIYRTSGNCAIDRHGGVLIINEGNEDAIVDIKVDAIYLAIDPNTFSTRYYEIDNKKCVVLDATAGEYGYPGYDSNLEGEKTAISSVTKKYYSLA